MQVNIFISIIFVLGGNKYYIIINELILIIIIIQGSGQILNYKIIVNIDFKILL